MIENPKEGESNYSKYRGKCKEYVDAACAENSDLIPVRGYYFCPIWGREDPHWWCKNKDGEIFDPTRLQFPSRGHGIYTEFDGFLECSHCGKRIHEDQAIIHGNYGFCSNQCGMRFVGL